MSQVQAARLEAIASSLEEEARQLRALAKELRGASAADEEDEDATSHKRSRDAAASAPAKDDESTAPSASAVKDSRAVELNYIAGASSAADRPAGRKPKAAKAAAGGGTSSSSSGTSNGAGEVLNEKLSGVETAGAHHETHTRPVAVPTASSAESEASEAAIPVLHRHRLASYLKRSDKAGWTGFGADGQVLKDCALTKRCVICARPGSGRPRGSSTSHYCAAFTCGVRVALCQEGGGHHDRRCLSIHKAECEALAAGVEPPMAAGIEPPLGLRSYTHYAVSDAASGGAPPTPEANTALI
jgi:hypothetical protein